MPKKRKKMPKKRKKQAGALGVKDLWIAPRYSLKGPAGERAWESTPGGIPNSARFLELADIALGNKRNGSRVARSIKNGLSPSRHDTDKTEPYSRK